MLYHKLCCYADTSSLFIIYLTTVQPHLEYASSVWDPYLKKDIEAIEHVQKFGLKVYLKDWHFSYDNLLNIANIPTLASRKQQLKLCELFNIINGDQKSISIHSKSKIVVLAVFNGMLVRSTQVQCKFSQTL